MKTHKNRFLQLTALMIIIMFGSCEEKEDYSHIVFKNYLTYEIERATNFLNLTQEGTSEGEYHQGSKESYRNVIDAAKLADENSSATQEEIDLAYQSLLTADKDFTDQMVPFRSTIQVLINYAENVQLNTVEGESEGNVRPGNKSLFQEAIDGAKALVALSNLTQPMLDLGILDLNDAIYFFNGEIIGKATTLVINPGFEVPGYETTDFGEVAGWNLFGMVEEWAPHTSIAKLESAPDGQFVAKIGSYTQGIYQAVEEVLHPNATYTLEFHVSLLSNGPDWQGKKFPAILRSRIIVFEEEPGDYNFLSAIAETYDTLGVDPVGFNQLSHSVTIDAVSNVVGKKVAIDIEQRHTWNSEEPIWAESFVAIDSVRLYRKL